jgi:thiamine kinase
MHPPLEIRTLAAGQSNLNYYLQTTRGEYVLRCYGTSTPGACRQQEFRCQQAAAAAGIAPVPLLLNNHQQLLISEYISAGQPLPLTADTLPQLAKILARLHSLRVQTPALSLTAYLRQLLAQTEQQTLQPAATLFAGLLQAAAQFEQYQQDLVLCHLDLHQDNLLLAAGKIWLLDFEYAQLADCSFDLAALSLHYQFSKRQQAEFLVHYQQYRCYADPQTARAHAASLMTRLALAKILYSGFCWLWYLAMPGYQQASAEWQLRLTQQLALQAT